jgi:hypothetical protein
MRTTEPDPYGWQSGVSRACLNIDHGSAPVDDKRCCYMGIMLASEILAQVPAGT